MIVLGDRILVSRIDEEKKTEGFQTVEVQDSFLYKGRVEQIGEGSPYLITGTAPTGSFGPGEITTGGVMTPLIQEGDVVLFAKYSPHTQTVTVEGQEMKIIRTEDVIAVL